PFNRDAGSCNITLRLGDGTATVDQTFSLLVQPINHAPVFGTTTPTSLVNSESQYVYNITATDADGDALSFAAVALPAWLTLADHGDGTATLSGTPFNRDAGSCSITLRLSDGSTTIDQTFSLLVQPINHAPVFGTTTPTSLVNSESQYVYNITASDADGAVLSFTGIALPAWLTLIDHGDGTATLSGTPFNRDAGSCNITLRLGDGTATVDQMFSLLIQPINHAPVFGTTTPTSLVNSESQYLYNIAASDADGAVLSFTGIALPAWLTLIDHGDGTATLSGTPFNRDAGSCNITLRLGDGSTTVDQAFSLLVQPINHAPVFGTTTPTSLVNSESQYLYNIAASDADGDVLSFTGIALPAWLTLVDHGDGTATLSGTPFNRDAGTYGITLRLGDGSTTVDQTFSLTVQPINHAPAFTSTPPADGVTAGDLFVYHITAADSDADALSFSALTLPAW